MGSFSVYTSILLPAFFAGFIVLITHIPLGRIILQRGIIFLDLALAQIVGMGIIAAGLIGFEPHGWELQTVAFISAMLGAFILSYSERIAGKHQEALIGVVFVLAATGSLILLSGNPQGGEHLQKVLVGQILWVEWRQLILPGVMSLFILSIYFLKYELFKGPLFYLLFAFAITNSVQLVGVYLVFAFLILPALSVIKLDKKPAIYLSLLIGVVGLTFGLVMSVLTDLPSGALIVWFTALSAVLFPMLLAKLLVNS